MRLSVTLACLTIACAASAQEQWLILDCPVSQSDPALDIAGLTEFAGLIRMERFRFAILPGGGAGVATTIRAANLPAKVLESATHFQIDFENKRVVIDRMTAEFQVSLAGAQRPLGAGSCTKLDQRKF